MWKLEFDYKDHLGNARVSFKEGPTGVIQTARTDFDPWGVRLNGTGVVNSFQNRWELQGKEKESTFNLNRVDFGARAYNPTIGRFDRVDPLAEERYSLTPYNYNSNNPVNRIDPTGALDEPIYKKAWDWIKSAISGSDANRATQSVAASTSHTLVKSEQVRKEYVQNVSNMDKTNSQGRTQAKMEAREKTPAVMREVAERMRPSSGESSRVGGTANKTNAGVNSMVGKLGVAGKAAGVTAVGFSVYNVSVAENKPQAVATEGGALLGAVAGGEIGAQAGAAIGVWFGGAGALPGAVIGGVLGSIGGGIIGAKAGESSYNMVKTKIEEKQ
ncbi:RHS repeat domain-containing protein [Leadbetterella sp. DM7]|uniref:RHS repeat domain-containing protein n=1 Tax=Leadbetterella sp. DM7 TaxID=3235085 RepID=UPI00349EFAB1